jgi:DNA polymerase
MTLRPSMDFETYSAAGFYLDHEGKIRGTAPDGKGGLPVVGTPQYAAHPSTDILCLSYNLQDWYGLTQIWIPGTPPPNQLLEYIRQGGEIEAFNITFEWWIWNMVGVRKYGWPELQFDQCYCVMAKARRYSLPGSLANVAKVLGTAPKDPEGGRLIQKLTRPHTPTKARPEIRWTPSTAWEDFVKLYNYCNQDVYAEDEVSRLIPELTADERAVWLVDQRVNARGVQVDLLTLEAMLSILSQVEDKYNAELCTLTGGAVETSTQLPALKAWLAGLGVNLPSITKDLLEEALGDPRIQGPARRALEIRQLLGSANIKKLHKFKLQTSSDGRLRDQYMYNGADRTGRFSAGGVQLQNMTGDGPDSYVCSECSGIFGQRVHDGTVYSCPRCGQWAGLIEKRNDWDVESATAAIADIRSGDLATVERYWGDDIVAVLCGCLRALLTAKPGHELICVDYSAIEAVVAACLARCQWRIDVFSGHGKIYEESAAKATGIPFEEILAYRQEHGQHHPARKTIGKVRELAGGYGGWINAWLAFGAGEFMNEDEIKADVLKWREESPEIVEAWGGQYRWSGPGKWDYRPELHGLEGAVIQALLHPGECFAHIDITYALHGDVLYCRLPSGRFLYYHRPRLAVVRDKLNRGDSYQITFEGWNSNAIKGPIGWTRMETWGGKLFENVTQAVALDIQAGAMVRCEAAGYPVVMHTHDEITAEVPIGQGSVEHMAEIMIQRPSWGSWWPIRGAGWRGERYRKD